MSKKEMPADIIQVITGLGFFGLLILGMAISIYGGQTGKYEFIGYAILVFPLAFIPLTINLYRQKKYKNTLHNSESATESKN